MSLTREGWDVLKVFPLAISPLSDSHSAAAFVRVSGGGGDCRD